MVSVLALFRFEALTDSMHAIVDEQVSRVTLAEQVTMESQNAAIQLLRLLQTPERDQRIPLYAEMDRALAISDEALRTLTTDLPSAEMSQLIDLRRQYGEVFLTTVETIEIEGLEEARKHFEASTDQVLGALLRETALFAGNQQKSMHDDMGRQQKQVDEARIFIIFAGGGAVILATVLAVFLSKRVTSPLLKAVNIANAIAGGEYGRAIPNARIRELDDLLRALGIMRESIMQREVRIRRLAYTDPLTNLPNRTRFLEVLDELLSRSAGTLAIIDINRFSQFNNALGQAVGDQLLRHVANRLSAAVFKPNFIARLDSDEFAVLLVGEADPIEARQRVQSVLETLAEPIVVEGQKLDIDARAGIVLFPEDGTAVSVLLRKADLAANAAKLRHDSCALGREFSQPVQFEHLSLLGEMREALQLGQFIAFYQPKYSPKERRVVGVEALLRWDHPRRGLVRPDLFIPFAEQTGFIRDITPIVLGQAVADAVCWRAQGLNLVVSVNISALDLTSPRLIRVVCDALEKSSLAPEYLCLEITESALMAEPDVALNHLRQLAAIGVRLSIDDYGAGHASLSYVKDLPVDELKIDRSFVRDIHKEPKLRAIVWSTILLCRELGLDVVAEGVENAEESLWLEQHKCDVLQGYHVARPMRCHEVRDWVVGYSAKLSEVVH